MARFPDPRRFVKSESDLFQRTTRSLRVSFASIVKDAEARFGRWDSLLESLSYKRVLDRGYALVRDADGRAVSKAAAVMPGMALAIQFADATVDATAGQTTGGPGGGRPEPKPKPPRGKDPKQGSLL